MMPDAHAMIQTEDEAVVMCSFQGRTVWIDTSQGIQGRQLLWVLFEAEDERYRWLNDTLCVLDGKIDRQTGRMEAHIYACVSDLL